MTFSEIVTEVSEELRITAAASLTRIGREVNTRYKQVTSAIGLNLSRMSYGVSQNTAIGIQTLTYSTLVKVVTIYNAQSGQNVTLIELTPDELRALGAPSASDAAITSYAVTAITANSVTITLNALPQTIFPLYADGYALAGTLSGTQTPAFNEDFHDILVTGVLADELRQMEKRALANDAEARFNSRLGDLRMFIAKSSHLKIVAGKNVAVAPNAVAGGGGGVSGGSSYAQTGLITFSRSPSAPFAVTAASAKVTNLDADLLDGQNGTDYHDSQQLTNMPTARLLGRTTAGTGVVENISAAASILLTATSIAVNTAGVTSAMLRNSAAVSVIGRSANSSGVPADIAASADGQVLRRAAAAVGFSNLDLSTDCGSSIAAVANGGTGLATLATSRIPFGNGTGVYQSNAAFLFDGTTFTTTGQIKFPATQVPSSDANTLDDYEEGQWTPTDASGAGLSLTIQASNCTYIKIGKMVYCSYMITFPVTASGAVALFGGLPFTAATSTNAVWAQRMGYSTEANAATMSINSANTQVQPLDSAGGTITNVTFSTDALRGAFMYQASA